MEPGQIEHAQQLKAEGLSFRSIAEKLGVPLASIYRALKGKEEQSSEDLAEEARQAGDTAPASRALANGERPGSFSTLKDLTKNKLLIVYLIQEGSLQAQESALAYDILTQHGEETFFWFVHYREGLQARTVAAHPSPGHASNGRRSIH